MHGSSDVNWKQHSDSTLPTTRILLISLHSVWTSEAIGSIDHATNYKKSVPCTSDAIHAYFFWILRSAAKSFDAQSRVVFVGRSSPALDLTLLSQMNWRIYQLKFIGAVLYTRRKLNLSTSFDWLFLDNLKGRHRTGRDGK